MVLACLCCGAAGVCSFIPRWPASVIAYCAMVFVSISGATTIGATTYVFWGIATLITIGINYMLPYEISRTRAGLPYIAGGALTGTAVGMATNTTAGVISGTALGVFFGALAYANTSAGRAMAFPSSKFFNYLAAKGLPIIVTLSMVGIVLSVILTL